MELNAADVRGLAAHLGYGNPAGGIWFVGGEEGLGGQMKEHERAANLKARARWAPIMDLASAHETLKENGSSINDLINRPGMTVPWRFMARIARAFEGKPDFENAVLAANYVRCRLGRAGGATFLTELSPFPAAVANQPVELQQFADKALIRKVRVIRREEQLRLLRQHQPRVVICYGTNLHSNFEQHFALKWRLLRRFQWRSKKSETARETPIFHSKITYNHGAASAAFRLPFFGQGALGTDVLRQFVATPEFRAAAGLPAYE